MTPTELENFILAQSAEAWRDLIEMDQQRGGSGQLRDTAVSLMRGRTMIAVHCDCYADARMLTAWFALPEPLPGAREPLAEFLVDLHAWLEGKEGPAPKLPMPEPRVLH